MNILVSYNWLKEYVETKLSAQKMAQELSLSGPSVERVIDKAKGLEKVVVGELKEIKKHPEADRLNISQVDIGSKTIQVIFGEVVKMKVGDRVPVAVAPTTLPGEVKIETAKLRGELSEGMLCLDSELGLSKEKTLRYFDESVKPGTPLVKILDLKEAILDIEITTNRPDNLSIVGIAREAAAITGAKFKEKKIARLGKSRFKLEAKEGKKLEVIVKEKKLCPRYTAVVIDGVEVKESPSWLQSRLISVGLRPINNIVDITNYVMLEYGQPLHAFDYDKLADEKIIVRKAQEKEKIVALDGQKYKLANNNLVIADGKEPVAIAGVMGGEYSRVTSGTKTLVLEAAIFDPYSVRKTSRNLNLYSDSSYRFEKGLSTELPEWGARRAVELIKEIAGGEIASKFLDVRSQKFKAPRVKFNLKSVERYLGVRVPVPQIIKMLTTLGFKVKKQKESLNIEVPFWREYDVSIEEDIIEEVARIYGYHNLPVRLPEGEIPVTKKNWEFYWEDRAKEFLAGAGLSEIYSYSFISKKLLENLNLNPDRSLKVLNPLNEDLEYLRVSLLPSVLNVVSENQNIREAFRIFELSKVYLQNNNNKNNNIKNELPREPLRLCGALVDAKDVKDSARLFYEAKGILELLFKKMGIEEVKFRVFEIQSRIWQAGHTANVEIGTKTVGQIGEISSLIRKRFDIKKKVVAFNLDFEKLIEASTTHKSYIPLPKFPAIRLDLAMILPQNIFWQEVEKTILSLEELLLTKVELFDIYEGEKIETGKKSLAFRLTYHAPDHTLKFEEAEKIQGRVIGLLEEKFGAQLRK